MIDYSEKHNDSEGSASGQSAPADNANDVLIHVMPEQFRSGGAGQNAKSTGLIILIGGVVALVVGSAAIYYFVFKVPVTPKVQTQAPVGTATTTKQVEDKPAQQVQPVLSAASSTQPVATSSAIAASAATTTAVATTPSASGEAMTPSSDADRDGLTDEEELVFGSDKDSQDSDGDGFGDYVELRQGYNPAGPGKLVSNSKMKISTQKSFTIIYPASWTEKNTGGDYLLLWQAPDNQMVQVNTEKLSDATNIVDWYKQRFSVSDIPVDRIVSKKDDSGAVNWTGVKSGDGLAVYFLNSKNGELYTISYNAGLDSVIKYPNLFQSMVDSLTLN